jgi:hypothetical protein
MREWRRASLPTQATSSTRPAPGVGQCDVHHECQLECGRHQQPGQHPIVRFSLLLLALRCLSLRLCGQERHANTSATHTFEALHTNAIVVVPRTSGCRPLTSSVSIHKPVCAAELPTHV